MPSISSSDMANRAEPQRKDAERVRWIGRGLLFSLALHVLAALLVFLGLPGLMQKPPQVQPAMTVDLVRLADISAAPQRQQTAALPQQKAPETAKANPIAPVPRAQVPPPTPATRRPEFKIGPEVNPLASLTPQIGPSLPRSKRGPKSDPLATTKPTKTAPPIDDLNAQLASLARLQQQQAQMPPDPDQQEDAGASDVTASNNATLGALATYSVKDFIRAQIERHWYIDKATRDARDIVVSIHLTLNGDGSVGSADIVDDPQYSTDAAYRAVALSARDAILMSSPLNLPPGRYDDVKDLTLRFSPKDVLR